MAAETFTSFVEQDPEMQPHWGGRPSSAVADCRRLVARRYLEVGFVAENELVDGFVSPTLDPYVDRSEYFWKKDKNGKVIATFRMIHANYLAGELDLPIDKEFALFDVQRQILHEAFAANPESAVEISALAKEKGVGHEATLDMYKGVWQHAKRLGLSVCAISADEKLHETLKAYFGDAIEEAGEPTEMMGSRTVPSLLYPDRCAEAVAAIYRDWLDKDEEMAHGHRAIIGYIIDGLENKYLSQVEIDAFASMRLMLD